MAVLLDIVTKGSTDRSVVLRICDSSDGTPETGVTSATSGLDIWYRREGAAKVSLTESDLSALTDAHSDGGMLHISDGEYRVDMPDAAYASGANYVDFGGGATGMVVFGGRVRLVNFDLETATQNVNATQISGDSTAADNLEALLDGTGGVTLTASAFTLTTPIQSNAIQISGDATAADNLEAILDGTGGVTVVLGALTVSGAFGVAGGTVFTNSSGAGFTCSSSGGNGAGISISGNGSGSGISSTGGATGRGAHFVGGATSGAGILASGNGNGAGICGSGTGANPGMAAVATSTGSGLLITGGGTSGHGIEITLTSGTGIVTPSANITGTFTVATNAIAWNAAWDAEVQSEASDALTAYGAALEATAQSILTDTAEIGAAGAGLTAITGLIGTPTDFGSGTSTIAANLQDLADNGTATYDRSTDSLQALRDRGDAEWITATGFSTHSAADVWAVATRVLTANTNLNDPTAAAIADAVWDEATSGHTTSGTFGEQLKTDVDAILDDTGTAGVVVASLSTTAKAEVNAEVDTALTDYDPPTRAELTTDTNSVLARVRGVVIADGTIGSTGNDTTHVHISDFTYGDDEINGYLLVVYDVSESEYHWRKITDWVNSTKLATVDALPFTPQASTDGYFLLASLADASVTGGDATSANQATIISHLTDIKGATWSSSTDTLEGIRDRGDSAWITATGFSTHSAADVVNEWETQSQADPTGFHVNVYEYKDLAQTQADLGGNINQIQAKLNGLIPVWAETIGSTGNDTTHLHLQGLTYGDDELNDMLLVIYDNSASEYHWRWIDDWVLATELATVSTLPFTPENGVDTFHILSLRKDPRISTALPNAGPGGAGGLPTVTSNNVVRANVWYIDDIGVVSDGAGSIGVSAASVRTAIGMGAADLDTQLNTIYTDIGTGLVHMTDIKGATFSGSTDSLEALRNRGDAAWITATGFSTHSAADVWAAGTRTLTANTNLNDPTAAAIADAVWDEATTGHVNAGTFGEQLKTDVDTLVTNVAAVLDDTGTSGVVVAAASKTGYSLSSTQTFNVTGNITGNLTGSVGSLGTQAKLDVNAEVDTALADIHLDHLLAADYDPASKPGTATALLNEIVENDGGVSRFTANALEQSPSGGTSPNVLLDTTVASVTSQVVFVLTAGSNDDDAYNDQAVVLYDASNSDYPSVRKATDYDGATKTLTIDSAPDFTLAGSDGIKIFVTAPGTTAPTAAQVRAEIDSNSTQLAAIIADTTAILDDTANGVALSTATLADIADAILERTDGVESGLTLKHALQAFIAVLAGKMVRSGTTFYFRDTNDTKNRVTATMGSSGRNSVSLDFD